MSEDISSGKRSVGDDFGAIDVAVLMEKARIEVPSDIMSNGLITVKGTVVKLRPSEKPTMVYGDLRGFDQSVMSFLCPATSDLCEKDSVILRGTLSWKRSPYRGLNLEIVGERIGRWTPHRPTANVRTPLDRGPKLALQQFILQGPANNVVLIGTETGIKDVLAALDPSVAQKPQTFITTTGLQKLQAVITDVGQKYQALCFVRGGGDSDSFDTWNDKGFIETLIRCGKPFYTGLGHAEDVTLADKYADQMFTTPSNLGHALRDAWRALDEEKKKENHRQALILENKRLKAANEGTGRTELDKAVTAAIKASMQEDFRRPFSEAIQGPIANLTQVTEQARSVLTRTVRELRLHAWTWLASVFLFGVFVGAYGLYSLERSTIFGMRHEATGAPQGLPATAKPPDEKAGSRHRGH